MDEDEKIMQRLALLEDEHRSLDVMIEDGSNMDPLHIKRLKKRKLRLKDEISRLHDILYPDIIA